MMKIATLTTNDTNEKQDSKDLFVLDLKPFGIQWIPLGSGSYNQVDCSLYEHTIDGYTSKWILKKQVGGVHQLSDPKRAIRKWKILNPNYPVYLVTNGWIAPYLGSDEASDNQLANKLVDIYRNTRHIVLDACSAHNVLVYGGKSICVDVDLAYRRGSFASDEYLSDNYSKQMRYLNHPSFASRQCSVSVIKALMHLEQSLSDESIRLQCITRFVIEGIYGFYQQQRPMTVTVLERLFAINELVTDGALCDINGYYMTPSLMQQLEPWWENGYEPTVADLESLIDELPWNRAWVIQASADVFFQATKRALQRHPNWINKTNDEGYQLLHLAALRCHVPLVTWLQQQGCTQQIEIDLNARADSGMTAIDLALAFGGIAGLTMVRALIQAEAELPSSIFLQSFDAMGAQTNPPSKLEQFDDHLERWQRWVLNPYVHSAQESQARLEWLKTYPTLVTWALNDKGDTMLHMAFAAKHEPIVNALVARSDWPTLSKTKHHGRGWTLLHFMAHYGYRDYWSQLSAIGIDDRTFGSQSTALHIAAHHNRFEMCCRLLEHGSNPMLTDKKGQTAEEYWTDFLCNPFDNLRLELRQFACNDPKLSTARSGVLQRLVMMHPHFLTWPLHQTLQDETVLKMMFLAQNTRLIDAVLSHPKWNVFSQVRGYDACWAHLIAHTGQEAYYEQLRSSIINKPHRLNQALLVAVEAGHESMCRRLMEDDADPNAEMPSGVTCLQLWQRCHPDRLNPLLFHCRNRSFDESKARILQCIDAAPMSNLDFENQSLSAFRQIVDKAQYEEENHRLHQTANNVWRSIIDRWEQTQRKSVVPSRSWYAFFFPRDAALMSSITTELLASINSILNEQPDYEEVCMAQEIDYQLSQRF